MATQLGKIMKKLTRVFEGKAITERQAKLRDIDVEDIMCRAVDVAQLEERIVALLVKDK
jgi:hypothetical protein